MSLLVYACRVLSYPTFSHPKTFNLIGAASVLFGSGLQIAALIIPPTLENFLLCAAGGNVFKMVGGAVRHIISHGFLRRELIQLRISDLVDMSHQVRPPLF